MLNSNIKLKFKATELQCFSWLYNIAPCFPVKASKVNIITDPRSFYDTLCERFRNANRRISVASLYIGTGELEKKLLEDTKENMLKNNGLKVNVLLDYQRGTRGEFNSKSLVQNIMREVQDRCNLYLYQTPRLQGSWSKALPSRYNEIIGLQHMKLYIADDSVILSGANCSNDYFTQRQDRYVEIVDADLADFYSELLGEVHKYSKKCDKDTILENKKDKTVIVKEVNAGVKRIIQTWKDKQDLKYSGADSSDTWIFPLVQMGEFFISQDEHVTQNIFSSAPEGSCLRVATGYFNLTNQYADTILNKCKANISLLMAHPNANGFLGASGPAGGIPHAYSLIAKQFWQKVIESGQDGRVEMLEYERPGWTFHAKGLWYYPASSELPCATVVGSANLGERSVRRDLEAQAAILTTSDDLKRRLESECRNLHEHASECSMSLSGRRAPLWVRATVGLFRTYF